MDRLEQDVVDSGHIVLGFDAGVGADATQFQNQRSVLQSEFAKVEFQRQDLGGVEIYGLTPGSTVDEYLEYAIIPGAG